MKFHTLPIIIIAVAAMVSCGKTSETKDSGSTDSVATADVELGQILNGGAVKMSETIDNMALNADDLEPNDALKVLVGYIEIEKNAREKGRRKLAMETMRKYVDVYDIAISNHGNDMRAAISRNTSTTGIDLTIIAGEFRDKLHGIDEGSGVEAAPVEQPDSARQTKSDSITTSDSADTHNPDLFE